MAPATGIPAAPTADRRARGHDTSLAHSVLRRPFYIGLSLLMGVIAVVGFWPTYFGPLLLGASAQPLIIHLHATVFAGWLALFLIQAALAASGRVQWHRRLGRIGIGYGMLVIVLGLVTGLVRSAERFRAGLGGEFLLFAALADMTMFSIFFGAAIALRRKPQLHKRLMLVAATMLLVAATARMTFLPSTTLRQAVWVSPILLALLHDFRSRHVIHPVYLLGLGAVVVRAASPQFIAETETWSAITRWLTAIVG
jgi:hypothetical protein